MSAIENRYGTTLRVYDNGGRSADRFTIIPPRWANEYREFQAAQWSAIASNAEPFHPQGVGMTCTAVPGPHLGKRIRWDELPADVQRFARQAFPEYAPRIMHTVRLEYTDTFAGEANYSWVRRATLQVAEDARNADVIRRAKAEMGISGRHRKDDQGDVIAIHPCGTATVLFITWEV